MLYDPSKRATLAAAPFRRWILALSAFSAVSSIGGGTAMVLWPRGGGVIPLWLLEPTIFQTFLVPGLLLGLVVGGTSALSALSALRRSTLTADLAFLAGGTLSVWIIAECAMLQAVSWLHAVYGVLGLAILLLGVAVGARSGNPRHTWVFGVTVAESIGFFSVALVALGSSQLSASGEPWPAALIVAGALEGTCLGIGQSWAFPISVNKARYTALTAAGAMAVWAAVLGMMALAQSDASVAVQGAAGGLAALIGLGAIGGAQWLELRRHVSNARAWIPWTALAWTLALPFSFAPGPFVDESTPLGSHLALWGSGGVMMAYVMALVTWLGVKRVTR